MVFQPVLNTVEIDVIYTQNGETLQNTFYAELLGGYVQSDLQALTDAVDLQISGSWKAEQPPESVYVRTEVRGLSVENDLTATNNVGAGPGVHAGNAMPNNVTFSIKKTSGLTGRSARGRTYWIGVPNTQIDVSNENFVNAPWAANVVTNVGTIRTTIAATGLWLPRLVSRFAAGVPRSSGKTFAWTGETNVDLRVDTLRGRLP